jgi:muramoyltetrapeptide carboxypeptidase
VVENAAVGARIPPLLPPRIAPGATIGVVTLATPAETRAAVERGVEWWESQGYRVVLGRSTRERGGDFAGPPELRAADLQAMFADREIAAIQTMRGGYGTIEVVPLLDYDAIAATPKPVVGLSDITNLHLGLARLAGLVSFYGPSLTMVGARPMPALTGDRLLSVLQGDGTGPVPYDQDGPHVRAIAGGRASGRIVGGCLPDLTASIGTPWELEAEGAILFFEVQGYGPTFIERHLIHLRQAGKLDGVGGVLVGELPYSEWGDGLGPDWPRQRTVDDVLDARLGDLGVPVLYGLPVGHGETMATLPLGVGATLDAEALSLTIDQPALA